MDLGVSSTRYTMKSFPKDFAILGLLLLAGVSLLSFSRTSSGGCSKYSLDVLDSGNISEEVLTMLCISFIGNIFSKNVASRDSIIVSTCISGTSDLTTKIYRQCSTEHILERYNPLS